MLAVYESTNQFKVSEDLTSEFNAGRRIKADCGVDGIKIATILSSTYSSPYTYVTINESTLTSNLTDVLYGIVQPGNVGSLPDHKHNSTEGQGGSIDLLDLTNNNFLHLIDTPTTYSGSVGKYLKVTVSGIEFFDSLIEQDTTFYLDSSGNDTTGDGSLSTPWQTLDKAWDYLSDKTIKSDATVTIKYLDGTHTVSSTYESLNHPCLDQIIISGETIVDVNITSVQSSSGSSGNYSIVFNVNTVSNISVGDYIKINYEASGGTNPKYACGVHEITNVDEVNTRLTVTSLHLIGVPSGAVSGSAKVAKTIISCTSGFINQTNIKSNLSLKDLAIVAGSDTIQVMSSTMSCSQVMVNRSSGRGFSAEQGGCLNLENCGASGGNAYALASLQNSTIIAPYFVASGVSTHGILNYYNSYISTNDGVSTGNSGSGTLCGYTSMHLCTDSHHTGNSQYGWGTTMGAVIRRTGTCTGGNNGLGDTSASTYCIVQT